MAASGVPRSIFSSLKDELLSGELKQIKEKLLHIRSLGLLSPELLRNRPRASGGKLGLGGG